MEEIVAFIVGLGCALLIVALVANLTDEKVIENFKNPTCIESKIGRQKIKKCYELVEINGEIK